MTFSQNKLVSVIIPSYNSARFLKDTITSVLEQSYKNIEVIVVNDGSTDDTENVIREFDKDLRFFCFKKENGGVSNARNFGFKKSKGDYIAFLDADDMYFPDNLKKKVEYLENNYDFDLAHSDIQYIDITGKKLQRFNKGLSGLNLHTQVLLWNECVIPAFSSSIVVRRKVLEKIGDWDENISTAADQDLTIRICKEFKIYRIPEPLVGYRIVDGSMGRNSEIFEKDHLYVYKKGIKNNWYENNSIKKISFAKLHLIIASTWWVQNRNWRKTIKHLLISFSYSPLPIFKKLFNA
jgi:glycosyltransferase involved in cell wall biosynthesis